MDVWLVHHAGEVLLHRTRPAAPAPLRKAIAPYREGRVIAVEGRVLWYGLAALGIHEGIPFGLGHAHSMQARKTA